MPPPSQRQRGNTTPILMLIVVVVALLAFACIVVGAYALYRNSTGDSEFSMWGMHVKSSSVGFAFAAFGIAGAIFSIRSVLKNLREAPPPPAPAPDEGGFNFSLIPGMSFEQAARTIAMVEDGTVDFGAMNDKELDAELQAQGLETTSAKDAMERLRFLTSVPIRPYRVTRKSTHFAFVIE